MKKRQTVLTVKELARLLEDQCLKVEIHGFEDFVIDHLRDLEDSDKGALTFFIGEDTSKLDHLEHCVLICRPGLVPQSQSVIRIITDEPKLAFYILAQNFAPTSPDSGIHPTAVIDPKAVVHPTATIGPFCVLEECTIGEKAILHSHVTLYASTRIGARAVIEGHTFIGATGQIWAWGSDGKRWVLPQIGGTVIGDDCFIGSNVSIVRGALQDTVIDRGCRIAHGSRIGHNCQIGKETFISNGVTIPGSVTIGNFCFLGSGSVYRSGIVLGDNITVGAGAVVTKSFFKKGLVLAGIPALPIRKVGDDTTLTGVPKQPANALRHK